MASPSRDERKSIQDEIEDISGIMAQIEVLLDDIKQRVDAISQRPFSEVEEIQNKLELVKRQNRHLIRTIKKLRNEQHELQRQLACRTQEAENAVEAYQDMRRKLRNARRVIRDIVDEAGSLNQLSVSQDEIDDALGDEDQDEFYDASESLSSDNDETVQQYAETDAPQSPVEPVPQDNPGMGDAAANNETAGHAETSLPGADDSIETDVVEVDDFDDDHTESYLFEQPDVVDPPVYEMQDKVPPAVSQGMVFGPFSRRNLQAHLGLADAVVNHSFMCCYMYSCSMS
ncbi:hypothetical protein BDQ12DRAFT_192372 [Crucibulum laeve]|uniref:Uncharacterized protein n=1 Tax=Crucibulum laeve TaxID=68775 RepID=A0A5C3MH40_9AGAR|nr:hypothetical protein BDQ12DRAFT_192372 [Crucibulum laeve]